jgi:hypothetical protein
MKRRSILGFFLGFALVVFVPGRIIAQDTQQPPPPKTNITNPNQLSKITIQVSGGDANAAIENASVYIKYTEEHQLKKDKKLELNVKTNREGTAHIPEAPVGRVLVQVVADGWKPFGRYYDIAQAKETLKIHLERPPKWY